MQYRSRRQPQDRPNRQYFSVVASEAKQLFLKRGVVYGVIAAVLTGAGLFAASLAAAPATMVTDSPHDVTTKGGAMNDQTPDQQQGLSGGTHIESTIESQTSSSGSGSQSHASVTVNGQQLSVPDNGTLHTTVPAGDGSASVDISRTNSDDGGSNDSLNVHVETQSGTMRSE